MTDSKFVFGVPALSLFPPIRKKFEYPKGEQLHMLQVPVRGQVTLESGDKLEYDLMPGEEGGITLLTNELIKVLFYHQQYPSLSEGEFFVVNQVKNVDDVLYLVGRVIRVVEEVSSEL